MRLIVKWTLLFFLLGISCFSRAQLSISSVEQIPEHQRKLLDDEILKQLNIYSILGLYRDFGDSLSSMDWGSISNPFILGGFNDWDIDLLDFPAPSIDSEYLYLRWVIDQVTYKQFFVPCNSIFGAPREDKYMCCVHSPMKSSDLICTPLMFEGIIAIQKVYDSPYPFLPYRLKKVSGYMILSDLPRDLEKINDNECKSYLMMRYSNYHPQNVNFVRRDSVLEMRFYSSNMRETYVAQIVKREGKMHESLQIDLTGLSESRRKDILGRKISYYGYRE